MTIVDRWITVVVNGETVKGVIRRACCSMVEVWVVAPQWCCGVRRTDFVQLKKPTRQDLIECGESMLWSLYHSCEAIREHKMVIVEAESKYNEKWERLNKLSDVVRKNIQLLKKETEEGQPCEAFDEKQNLLQKYRSMLFRLSRSKNRLIYSFITDFYKQIEVDNLLFAINRICETRFMSNNVKRKGIWKLQK